MIEVGEIYKHFKGGTYKVLGISKPCLQKSMKRVPIIYSCQHADIPGHSVHICEGFEHQQDAPEMLVVYLNTKTDDYWVRSVESWEKPLDDGKARFVLMKQAVKVLTPEEARKQRFRKEKKDANSRKESGRSD